MPTAEEFAEAVRKKYRSAFDLHGELAQLLQDTAVKSRYLPDLVARATDMLFVQGFKAHQSVYFLCSQALVEDAATIVRRLLELFVQAIYIARDSEESERTQRAGMYLAFLWHEWPADLRERIPPDERAAWESVYVTYAHDFKYKRWGPSFAKMFGYAGRADTYEEDYSLLCGFAHGSPTSLVGSYSQARVELHPDRWVPFLLEYATRYALGLTLVWNDIFHLCDDGRLAAAQTSVRTFRDRPDWNAWGGTPNA